MFSCLLFTQYLCSFTVKLKQQSNGQAVGSSYFGAYGTTLNTAQTAQYPYGKLKVLILRLRPRNMLGQSSPTIMNILSLHGNLMYIMFKQNTIRIQLSVPILLLLNDVMMLFMSD